MVVEITTIYKVFMLNSGTWLPWCVLISNEFGLAHNII